MQKITLSVILMLLEGALAHGKSGGAALAAVNEGSSWVVSAFIGLFLLLGIGWCGLEYSKKRMVTPTKLLTGVLFLLILTLSGLSLGRSLAYTVPIGPQTTSIALAQAQQTQPNPTYYRDVAPIIERSCLGCHREGGIGPVRLDTPADLTRVARLMVGMTQSGAMPPWMPGPKSPPFLDDRRLSSGEKALLSNWVATGTPLGDPADAPVATAKPPAFVPDLVLPMPVTYTPKGKDDYRCFILDYSAKADEMVEAFAINPDNNAILHHVILFLISENDVKSAIDKDNSEDGPGWTCFGGPGVGGIQTAANGWLGAWAPGNNQRAFPAGTAMRIPKGSRIVMQLHYNTSHGGGSDRSSVALKFAAPNAQPRPLKVQLLLAPVEIPCPQGQLQRECLRINTLRENVRNIGARGAIIPQALLQICNQVLATISQNNALTSPNASNASTFCDHPLKEKSLLYGVAGHMHQLGTSIRIERILDNKSEVLLDIPAWDFHWQDMYVLKTPLVLSTGEILRVTCTYDNSGARSEGIAPRYITWGEGTSDEMCLAPILIEPLAK
jgi:hypothetical protein